MKIRMHYRFSGEVQGVGFRFRAYHAAGALGLTGWVQNETDGSVTLEAQGDTAAVNALPGMLENWRFIRIDHVESHRLPIDPEERSFAILG